jgi:hypothetical protein
MHAIGAPEGVTLLEFEPMNPEEQQGEPQEVQPPETTREGGPNLEDLPKCPDHQPTSFLKGKPWSILSLLCFINVNLKFSMFDALSYRSWMEPLDAYNFSCPEIHLESYVGLGLNTCLAMLSLVEVG